MAVVVSPRGWTRSVACHQWFSNGLSSMRILPTIWVHMWSVSRVSLHSASGRAGHISDRLECKAVDGIGRPLWLQGSRRSQESGDRTEGYPPQKRTNRSDEYIVSRFFDDAKGIFEAAESAYRSGQSVSDTIVLIGPDGAIEM